MAERLTSMIATRERASTDSLHFIGNATVLIQYAGLTVLTDPNFIHRGESVSIGYGLTTMRLSEPSMTLDDLPPLDVVVLSHYHGDHFDHVVEQRLDRSMPIVTTPDAADRLVDERFLATYPLETWQSHEVDGGDARLRITAMPGRHAPGPLTVALPDVMGSLLEFWIPANGPPFADRGPALRLYITGDTIFYEGLREIPERHPEIDLALVHLGGTRVMGVTVTMDAEQGVDLLRAVQPRLAVPIHYDDYDAFKSPIEDFLAAVDDAGLGERVRYLRRGDELPLAGASAW